MFSLWQRYVKYNGNREEHIEVLQELKMITDPKDMKDFDIFTAGGYALLGEHKQNQIIRAALATEPEQNIELSEVLQIQVLRYFQIEKFKYILRQLN